jgi:hypothetical protein
MPLTPSVIMLPVFVQKPIYDECRYAECRYAECRGVDPNGGLLLFLPTSD